MTRSPSERPRLMGDEDRHKDDHREDGELDHAFHEAKGEKRQHERDEDGELSVHLSRFRPNLFCASITMPTHRARIIAILMIFRTSPISRIPMTTAMMKPIIAPPRP